MVNLIEGLMVELMKTELTYLPFREMGLAFKTEVIKSDTFSMILGVSKDIFPRLELIIPVLSTPDESLL
jgi:hypothetical protein